MSTNISNNLPIGITLQGKSYNYVLQKVLGQGTFGITYLAEVQMQGALGSIESNIKVCIKEFFMHEINGREGATVTSGSQGGLYADYRKKFAREAQNLAKLQHPNIIKVLEFFEENNTIYYAMEYIDGGSLDDYIEGKGRIPEQETITLTKQIGSALAFMHQKKMLHLDLKPGNIMRKKDGTLVLIDFGLSKNYDSKGEPESSTTVGRGTPGYAPLEQANYQDGHGFPVTMDVYALGATMYKMLTGRRAPEASEILNEGFPSNTLQSCGVSDKLIAIVKKSMMPIKKNRYQNILDLIHSINEQNTSELTAITIADESTTVSSNNEVKKETVLENLNLVQTPKNSEFTKKPKQLHLGKFTINVKDILRFKYAIFLIFVNVAAFSLYTCNFDDIFVILPYNVLNRDWQYGIIQISFFIALNLSWCITKRKELKNEIFRDKILTCIGVSFVTAIVGIIALIIVTICLNTVNLVVDIKFSRSMITVAIETILSGLIASTILVLPEVMLSNKENT